MLLEMVYGLSLVGEIVAGASYEIGNWGNW